MGVSGAGPLCMIMGTSGCHMLPAEELRLFNGYAGVVKDGILPGLYGYESGQAAVGDIYGWFAKDFMGVPLPEIEAKAARLAPGESGLVALDWMNGNRSILMDANLSGAILGLTRGSTDAHVARATLDGIACQVCDRGVIDSVVVESAAKKLIRNVAEKRRRGRSQ